MRKTFLGGRTGKRLEEVAHLKGPENEFPIPVFLSECSEKREVRGIESGSNLSEVSTS